MAGSPPYWLIGAGVAGSALLIGFVVYEATRSSKTAAPLIQSGPSSGDQPAPTPAPTPAQPPSAAQAEFPVIPNPVDTAYVTPNLVDGTAYILASAVRPGTTVDQITAYFQSNDWTEVQDVHVGSANEMFGQVAPFAPLTSIGGDPAFFCIATYHTGCAIPQGLYAVSQLAYQTNQNAPRA